MIGQLDTAHHARIGRGPSGARRMAVLAFLVSTLVGCVEEEAAFESAREAGVSPGEGGAGGEAEPETCSCSREEACVEGVCQPRRDFQVEYTIADGELTVQACGPATAAYRNRRTRPSAWGPMRTGCRMWSEGQASLPRPGDFMPLDAGELSIRSPGGEALSLSREDDGCYRATGRAVFPEAPAAYTLVATGGADVAAFEQTLESPPPVVLDVAESYSWRADMLIRWNGASRTTVTVAASVIGCCVVSQVAS